MGFNWSKTKFNIPISNSNLLYKSFDFTGDELNNFSLYYQLRWSGKIASVFNFGEVAYSEPGSISQIHGIIIPLSKVLDIGFLWRAYSPSYVNFYATAYAIGENKNENTFSFLINWNLLPNQQLQIRSEMAKFP